MDNLKRIIGVYLIAVAVIVAVHTIIEPLYYTSTEADPYTPNWMYINPLMAIAVALSLILSYGCKRRADLEGGDAPSLATIWQPTRCSTDSSSSESCSSGTGSTT